MDSSGNGHHGARRPGVALDEFAGNKHVYSSTTGRETATQSLNSNVYDPAAGNFSASYDEGGRVAAVSMPGNITKSYEYDDSGAANYSQYMKTSGCTDDCLLYWSWAMENVHGQTVGLWGSLQNDGKESAQTFTYDKAGRLIRTDDWRDDGADWTCDTREYELDADSNRTKLTKYAPAGDCGQGATTTKNNSYDAADRLTNAGYTYDAFGRITTVPATDAGSSGDMTATYYVNDLARSITADGTTQTLALDPVGRMRNKLKTGAQSATESYAYTDDSDSPAWTSSGSTWTRYIDGPTGDVGAIQQSSGAVSLAISNLRGDIVAELTNGQLQAVREVDEFGVVKDGMPASRKYGFHGTKQREALTAGGTIAMGVRLYVPQTGRFLQVDPVVGGSAGPYEYAYQDPVSWADLDGRIPVAIPVAIFAARVAASYYARRMATRAAVQYVKRYPSAARAVPRYGQPGVGTAAKSGYDRAKRARGKKCYR